MNNEVTTLIVRGILLRDWDPCGVGGNSALKDEYDEFLPAIVASVAQKASSTTLKQLLAEFEKQLGIRLPEEQRERAVQALLELCP